MNFFLSFLMVFDLMFVGSLFSLLTKDESGDKFWVELLSDRAIAATPENPPQPPDIRGEQEGYDPPQPPGVRGEQEGNHPLIRGEKIAATPENPPQPPDIRGEQEGSSPGIRGEQEGSSPIREEQETEVKPCSQERWWDRFFELESRQNCLPVDETLKAQKNNDLDDEDLLPSRGAVAVSETIPYVISPRRTLLLNSQPIIRWNPVKDATSYTVIVKGPSGYLWQDEVTVSEVVYPGEPVLNPGVYYTIIVDANTGASSLDDENFVQGFEVINESDRLEINNAAMEIEATTEEEENLKLAKLYRENSLRSEAIAILEELATTGSDNLAIYELLGKLYREIGLVTLADKYDLKAVELAEIENAQ